MMMDFLPINRKEMNQRGWEQVDFVLVTGDAYVDHPSFGTAIISRLLESRGYKVAILPQPDWKSVRDFKQFGRPRLGFLINSGNVDSMVNNFSVFKHRRRTDVYSPGGKTGRRPDRALVVYSNRAKEAYKDVPVVIGGLEASLRRLGHYDYWSDKVRRSILLDAKADLLVYGMGERAVLEIAEALEAGIDARDISWIRGTCVRVGHIANPEDPDSTGDFYLQDDDIILPAFDEISGIDAKAKAMYGKSFAMQYRSNDSVNGRRIIEKYTDSCSIVQNPPQPSLEEMELDDLYALPYMRTYHPSYEKDGGVPAIQEVKFSITANRGCFGGCAFCAITYHQGREVRSRSKGSIVDEAKLMTRDPQFKGYIHDIGGPTANFHHPSCKKQLEHGMCGSKDCLFPKPCSQLDTDHSDYIDVLKAVRKLEGVKKVFIRSGIRYDYMLAGWKNGGRTFLEELCAHHVSGVLKVAPEHASGKVLRQMHKPPVEVFDKFSSEYKKYNKAAGLKQYMIPYFISSHPGSTLADAIELALYMKKTGFVPDQVQDFYPTPGTLATCVYYTEHDPFTGKPVYVAKDMKEKKMQRALLHFHKKENKQLVLEALRTADREDLIPVLTKNHR